MSAGPVSVVCAAAARPTLAPQPAVPPRELQRRQPRRSLRRKRSTQPPSPQSIEEQVPATIPAQRRFALQPIAQVEIPFPVPLFGSLRFARPPAFALVPEAPS